MESQTAKFLLDASQLLRMKNDSRKMDGIICQLNQKYIEITAARKNHHGNSMESCKFCGNAWLDGHFQFNILGHKHKMRKRKAKLENKSVLSSSMQRYLFFYNSRKDNVMVKKCLVCKAEIKCGMSKPKSEIKGNVSSNDCLNKVNRKKKKKSKNESYAGLSPVAVLQARLSSCQNTHIIATNDVVENVPINTPDINQVSSLINVLSSEENNVLVSTPRSAPSANSVSGHNASKTKRKSKKRKSSLKVDKKDSSSKMMQTMKKKSFVSQFLDLL